MDSLSGTPAAYSMAYCLSVSLVVTLRVFDRRGI